MKSKVIKQSELTSECWMVQVWGLTQCEGCEFLNTPDCGGEEIREKIRKGEYPKDGLKDQRG